MPSSLLATVISMAYDFYFLVFHFYRCLTFSPSLFKGLYIQSLLQNVHDAQSPCLQKSHIKIASRIGILCSLLKLTAFSAITVSTWPGFLWCGLFQNILMPCLLLIFTQPIVFEAPKISCNYFLQFECLSKHF
jgi:hypothetical protein